MREEQAAKHTPGPWLYRKGDEWSHSVVTHHGTLPDGSPNCWTVASINKQREPEHEANARLIATAPDLLNELINLTARFKSAVLQSGTDEEFAELAVRSARSVIARATGRSE